MILSIDNVQYFNECRPMYVCIIFYIFFKYYKQKITIMANDHCENVQHIFRNRSQTPYAYSLVILKYREMLE